LCLSSIILKIWNVNNILLTFIGEVCMTLCC
jgi:hypothetical protein